MYVCTTPGRERYIMCLIITQFILVMAFHLLMTYPIPVLWWLTSAGADGVMLRHQIPGWHPNQQGDVPDVQHPWRERERGRKGGREIIITRRLLYMPQCNYPISAILGLTYWGEWERVKGNTPRLSPSTPYTVGGSCLAGTEPTARKSKGGS